MSRARTGPDNGEQDEATGQPEEPLVAAESSGKTRKLKYSGPTGQMVAGLGFTLKDGETYEVPEEMADSLIASSRFWDKA